MQVGFIENAFFTVQRLELPAIKIPRTVDEAPDCDCINNLQKYRT